MSKFKQKISDFILRRAEKKAHYKTTDLSITGFDDNYDIKSPHDQILLDAQMSFYNQRYDFVKTHLQKPVKILEIGDVNGFNIARFGTDESLSVNFMDFSRNIKNKFKVMNVNNGLVLDETFDYGMMFETLEHLHNPILILNQILDKCEGGLFLSIPYVKKTNVRLNMDGGHVFEFSPDDFKRIIDFYDISIMDYKECNVLKTDLLTKSFKLHSILNGEPDSLFGIFEKFQLYYLKKANKKQSFL
ncbi:methyltransferase domain-containing protein [uncultured Methanolobus sp.]|uniref:methyltransferase domain-containing protein n=1 Tax=uncultured Methanolobus sp. TaxID=218300 RepID=UPI0029C6E922|nr:hypothetical protein [uncultured Methanolobus sp.]